MNAINAAPIREKLNRPGRDPLVMTFTPADGCSLIFIILSVRPGLPDSGAS